MALMWADALRALAAIYTLEQDALNQLDQALGDGDHGTALSIAYADVGIWASANPAASPESVFKTAALTLMNRMGGSSGVLYGTLYLRLSTALAGISAPTAGDLAAAFAAGLDGVIVRGKAQVGDKTLVDALAPAVTALKAAADAGAAVPTALRAAASAARAGADSTKNFVAKHGRARYVGERSLGSVDAGAVSMALLFETLADWADADSGAAPAPATTPSQEGI